MGSKAYILFLFLLTTIGLRAQTLEVSFEEARKRAVNKFPEIQLKKIQVGIQSEQILQWKAAKSPDIFSEVNLQHNLIIPTTPVPAHAFDPSKDKNEILPMKFSTKWSGNAGVSLEYDLFNPDHRVGTKQKRLDKDIAQVDLELSEQEIIQKVSQSYISSVISKEQVLLSIKDTLVLSERLHIIQERYLAGRADQIELNDAKAQLQQAVINFEQAKKIENNTLFELKYFMGMDPLGPDQIILKDDNLDHIITGFKDSKKDSTEGLMESRYAMEMEKLYLDITREKQGALPALSLGGYMGGSFYDNRFNIYKDKYWHGHSYVNLNLKIPISSWYTSQHNIKEAKLKLQANELEHLQFVSENRLKRAQLAEDIKLYERQYGQYKQKHVLHKQSYELVDQQFKEGRLLLSEVMEAEYKMQQAKYEYLNSAYNLFSALLELEYLDQQ